MTTFGERLPELHGNVPGPVCRGLVDQLAQTECPALTVRRARRAERSGAPQDPIVWSRALGANVQDADGNVFVDLSAGFGAASIGHAHPRVVAAVQAQTDKLMHALGDLHPSDVKIALLSKLAALSPFADARVMLGLSGADAVEAALKTAALYTRKPGVLAFEGGYHGLHYGALSACGYSSAFRAPFSQQLNPHVAFAPYPRADTALDAALQTVTRAWDTLPVGVSAVLVEPMLGRGGIVAPPAGFLRELSALCRARGALLVVDEIMSGLHRTGPLFASDAEAAHADLLCIGKALGSGMPVSACLGRADVMAAWGDPGGEALHTATFFGHPLSCAAALVTLQVLNDEALGQRAQQSGAWLLAALARLQRQHPAITDVRGRGLLLGVECCDGDTALALGRALLARGYITVPAGNDARVISLTPPLSITQAQLAGFIAAFEACLSARTA